MASKEKKERIRVLKKRRKEDSRKEDIKARLKIYAFRGFLVIIVLILAYFVYATKFDYSGQGILQPVKSYHDFGFISVASNVISTEIKLINTGEGDLTIKSVDTSCGCTAAKIINNGIESPDFGMRGNPMNSNDWKTIIPSGEEAVLIIYYNPKTHPDLRGAVTRVVNRYTDDPSNEVHEIKIKVNQVD